MVKQISKEMLDSIINIVRRSPQGASTDDILNELTMPLSRRSLQRYLALLVERNLLTVSGQHLLDIP